MCLVSPKARQPCVLHFPTNNSSILTSVGLVKLSSGVALERGSGAVFLKQTYKHPSCFCLLLCLSPLKALWHIAHCFLTLPTAGVGLTFAPVLNQLPLTFLLSCFLYEVITIYSPVLLSLCIKKIPLLFQGFRRNQRQIPFFGSIIFLLCDLETLGVSRLCKGISFTERWAGSCHTRAAGLLLVRWTHVLGSLSTYSDISNREAVGSICSCVVKNLCSLHCCLPLPGIGK